MILTTKYSIGDIIWFLHNGSMHCLPVAGIESMISNTDDVIRTRTVYYTEIKQSGKAQQTIIVSEESAFESQEALIQNLHERYFKSLEASAE
jgi:hypothetical protein